MILPELFKHYTTSVTETETTITVKTSGAIANIDRITLNDLGWVCKSPQEFFLVKEFPDFQEVKDVDEKRRGLFSK